MKEFYITNINTKETAIIFGYNATNAFRRAKLEATDWEIDMVEYVD